MSGKVFLLTQSASKHILVFLTPNNIGLLAATKTWGMDSTFKVVPQWYQQLLTINVETLAHTDSGLLSEYAGTGLLLPLLASGP
ncbi:hypothetical protein T10_3336 [Trichinella papuae]|uniref:Uncharacterized protein n=1 Tax=Trichinella papuae TaxID=268474 RepID=A0A0V1M537_9BILA|nr:hypothetical protein T10_7928 [Trichinella papuae]KRZ66931.1 hypothetical protein T10_8641 [Trichinella papuae]KRZ73175.1 hypothetical protein T10_3336 [Trichinella papuae]